MTIERAKQKAEFLERLISLVDQSPDYVPLFTNILDGANHTLLSIKHLWIATTPDMVDILKGFVLVQGFTGYNSVQIKYFSESYKLSDILVVPKDTEVDQDMWIPMSEMRKHMENFL